MLNRQSSSSKKCSPAPATANEQRKTEKKIKKRQKKQSPRRSPLMDLNNGSLSRNNSSSSSISSSMSIEAPKGCLRFFLSNPSSSSSKPSPSLLLHRPKHLSKISLPKSAPQKSSNPFSSSRSTLSNTKENHHILKPSSQKLQSGKKPSSKTALKPNPSSIDLKQKLCNLPNNYHPVVENHLTPVGKLVCGFGLDCVIDDNHNIPVKQNSATSTTSASSKTPPVQASVSPEIQCGSSLIQFSTTTPSSTCYGAGHVVSGVTDGRKCRPKGILTVGCSSSGIDSSASNKAAAAAGGAFGSSSPSSTATNNNNISSSDGDDSIVRRVFKPTRRRRSSLIPLPAEASMSWLLSPCRENDWEDQTGGSANGFRKLVGPATLDLPSSSPSSLCNFSGTGNKDSIATTTSSSSRKTTRITLLSPRTAPEFQGLAGLSFDEVVGRLSSSSPRTTPTNCKAAPQQEEDRENSPVFCMDTLGNGNVIQTPISDDDSSSERRIGQSWLNGDVLHPNNKCHFATRADDVVGIGKTSLSRWDPLGLSFKLANLNRASWTPTNSLSSMEKVSESQMRISWREGLASRIFEMDEFDCCCRWLSDEENDLLQTHSSHELNADVKTDDDDGYLNNDRLKPPEFLEDEPNVQDEGKGKRKVLLVEPSSCAESICTDGGGLVASGDSDWTLCYKNKLFEL